MVQIIRTHVVPDLPKTEEYEPASLIDQSFALLVEKKEEGFCYVGNPASGFTSFRCREGVQSVVVGKGATWVKTGEGIVFKFQKESPPPELSFLVSTGLNPVFDNESRRNAGRELFYKDVDWGIYVYLNLCENPSWDSRYPSWPPYIERSTGNHRLGDFYHFFNAECAYRALNTLRKRGATDKELNDACDIPYKWNMNSREVVHILNAASFVWLDWHNDLLERIRLEVNQIFSQLEHPFSFAGVREIKDLHLRAQVCSQLIQQEALSSDDEIDCAKEVLKFGNPEEVKAILLKEALSDESSLWDKVSIARDFETVGDRKSAAQIYQSCRVQVGEDWGYETHFTLADRFLKYGYKKDAFAIYEKIAFDPDSRASDEDEKRAIAALRSGKQYKALTRIYMNILQHSYGLLSQDLIDGAEIVWYHGSPSERKYVGSVILDGLVRDFSSWSPEPVDRLGRGLGSREESIQAALFLQRIGRATTEINAYLRRERRELLDAWRDLLKSDFDGPIKEMTRKSLMLLGRQRTLGFLRSIAKQGTRSRLKTYDAVSAIKELYRLGALSDASQLAEAFLNNKDKRTMHPISWKPDVVETEDVIEESDKLSLLEALAEEGFKTEVQQFSKRLVRDTAYSPNFRFSALAYLYEEEQPFDRDVIRSVLQSVHGEEKIPLETAASWAERIGETDLANEFYIRARAAETLFERGLKQEAVVAAHDTIVHEDGVSDSFVQKLAGWDRQAAINALRERFIKDLVKKRGGHYLSILNMDSERVIKNLFEMI